MGWYLHSPVMVLANISFLMECSSLSTTRVYLLWVWTCCGKASASLRPDGYASIWDIENPSWEPVRNGVHLSAFVFQKSRAIVSDFCGIQTHEGELRTEIMVRFRKSQLSMKICGSFTDRGLDWTGPEWCGRGSQWTAGYKLRNLGSPPHLSSGGWTCPKPIGENKATMTPREIWKGLFRNHRIF